MICTSSPSIITINEDLVMSEWEKCFKDANDPLAELYCCPECNGKGVVALVFTLSECSRCEASGILFEDDPIIEDAMNEMAKKVGLD